MTGGTFDDGVEWMLGIVRSEIERVENLYVDYSENGHPNRAEQLRIESGALITLRRIAVTENKKRKEKLKENGDGNQSCLKRFE